MIRDITGQTFDRLTAIRPTSDRRYGSVVWEFKCECGNTKYRSLRSIGYSINHQHTISCGCARQTRVGFDHMIGHKFGKLLVVDVYRNRSNNLVCKCICECGSERNISPYVLNHGRRSSCSHDCRSYRPKLPHGESNCRQIYSLYNQYASRNNIPFELTFDQFLQLTQDACHECGQRPNIKWDSVSINGRNGAYIHNKIAYIDRDIGYAIGNVLTVCLEHINSYRIDHRV